jgi:hypothetical protein
VGASGFRRFGIHVPAPGCWLSKQAASQRHRGGKFFPDGGNCFATCGARHGWFGFCSARAWK